MLSSVFDWEKKFSVFLVSGNDSKSLKNGTDKGTKQVHLRYKLSLIRQPNLPSHHHHC